MCECVVILRNLKDASWAGAKTMMADTQFLRSLVEFDKDSLSEKQVRPWRGNSGHTHMPIHVLVLVFWSCSHLFISGTGVQAHCVKHKVTGPHWVFW